MNSDKLTNNMLRVCGMGNLMILLITDYNLVVSYSFTRYLFLVCVLTEVIFGLQDYNKYQITRRQREVNNNSMKWELTRTYCDIYKLTIYKIYLLNILIFSLIFLQWQYINYAVGVMYSAVELGV